jgi:hypothetical protein
MIVRIRFGKGRPVQRTLGKNRHLALAFGALLIPASLMAYALGFWRLAADMGLTRTPGVTGIFSHWQACIGLAVLLSGAASILNRYGGRGVFQIPKGINPGILPLSSISPRGRAKTG